MSSLLTSMGWLWSHRQRPQHLHSLCHHQDTLLTPHRAAQPAQQPQFSVFICYREEKEQGQQRKCLSGSPGWYSNIQCIKNKRGRQCLGLGVYWQPEHHQCNSAVSTSGASWVSGKPELIQNKKAIAAQSHLTNSVPQGTWQMYL